MYSTVKKLLFLLDPEQAHHFSLTGLNLARYCGLLNFYPKMMADPVRIMNLDFSNRIGLAAGLDKNADYIDALAALGFGFIEVGTVTPKPQSGNPKPRLFRLEPYEAIINRMGFNSKGAEYVVRRLEKTAYRGVLGINIGKNKDTALEDALEDYLFGFRAFWKFASYLTINLSSPNTPGLRALQQGHLLAHLLHALKQEQRAIFLQQKKYVPLVVKISPDLSQEELHAMAAVFLAEKIDGVIATNTTVSRPDTIASAPYAKETGGLSGRPLCARSTHIIAQLNGLLQNQIPIIASGGIMDAATAREKYQAGAALLQIYSGFIYSGPALVRRLVRV